MNNNITTPIYAPEPTEILTQELETEQLISTPEVIQERLAICSGCKHRVINDLQIPMCNLCGCNITMMATMNFKTCPIGLWQ